MKVLELVSRNERPPSVVEVAGAAQAGHALHTGGAAC